MEILVENKLSEEFKKVLYKAAREQVKDGKGGERSLYLAYAISRDKPYRSLEKKTHYDKCDLEHKRQLGNTAVCVLGYSIAAKMLKITIGKENVSNWWDNTRELQEKIIKPWILGELKDGQQE